MKGQPLHIFYMTDKADSFILENIFRSPRLYLPCGFEPLKEVVDDEEKTEDGCEKNLQLFSRLLL